MSTMSSADPSLPPGYAPTQPAGPRWEDRADYQLAAAEMPDNGLPTGPETNDTDNGEPSPDYVGVTVNPQPPWFYDINPDSGRPRATFNGEIVPESLSTQTSGASSNGGIYFTGQPANAVDLSRHLCLSGWEPADPTNTSGYQVGINALNGSMNVIAQPGSTFNVWFAGQLVGQFADPAASGFGLGMMSTIYIADPTSTVYLARDPEQAMEAATKQYADSVVRALSEAVRELAAQVAKLSNGKGKPVHVPDLPPDAPARPVPDLLARLREAPGERHAPAAKREAQWTGEAADPLQTPSQARHDRD